MSETAIEKEYRVYPECKGVRAPFLTVFASSRKEAVDKAKEKSGLGRFPNWEFTVVLK